MVNGKVYMAAFSIRLNVYGLFPTPVLSLALSGGNTIFTWPANTPTGYSLPMAANLVSGNWTAVANGVAASNGIFRVTVPLPGAPAAYYRLKL